MFSASLKNHALKIESVIFSIKSWLRRDLNLRPWAYESPALTTAPLSQTYFTIYHRSTVGGSMSVFPTTEFLIPSDLSYEFW